MGDKPDELAAAERAVLELAIEHAARACRPPALTNAVETLLRLRAAQDSQGSGG